jgi:hypothetical protein
LFAGIFLISYTDAHLACEHFSDLIMTEVPMVRTCRRFTKRGISLVEVLVVAGIVGGSVSIMVPPLLEARSAARKLTCAAKLKHVTQGVLQFESVFGALPPAGLLAEQQDCGSQGFGNDFGCHPISNNTVGDAPNHSWIVLILPYIGEEKLFDQFDLTSSIFTHPNDPQEVSPSVLQCPGSLKSAPNSQPR